MLSAISTGILFIRIVKTPLEETSIRRALSAINTKHCCCEVLNLDVGELGEVGEELDAVEVVCMV